MSLIVEDGTGRADAEVYCDVAFADAWHLARGITTWSPLTTTEKEAALRRAANFLVQEYRLRWHGSRATLTQALDWPRYDVPRVDGPGILVGLANIYASNVVPLEVKQANAELAFKAAAGDLAPDIDPSSLVKREKVDVIEVEYANNAPRATFFRSIEAILAPLLVSARGVSGAGSMTLVRA